MNENEVRRLMATARFKFRSDTLKNWEANNPVLLSGEAGVVTGLDVVGDNREDKSQKIKFGDGMHDWNSLDWWYGPEGKGSDITVDPTYNSESENPQSGKAVAEAVSSKMDKFGKVDTDGGLDIDSTSYGPATWKFYKLQLNMGIDGDIRGTAGWGF